MVDRLYVARGGKKCGPFSAAQLRTFAAAGRLLPTDAVWREGMDKAALAANVKNLFPAPQPPAPAAGANAAAAEVAPSAPPPADGLPSPGPAAAVQPESSPAAPVEQGAPAEPVPAVAAVQTGLAPPAPPAAPAAADPTSQPQAAPNERPPGREPERARKRRAVGVKGVVLLSQDGVSVHYRKKCSQCGFEDTCRSTMRIGQGVTRVPFFCPKCRKGRDVQIQGMLQ